MRITVKELRSLVREAVRSTNQEPQRQRGVYAKCRACGQEVYKKSHPDQCQYCGGEVYDLEPWYEKQRKAQGVREAWSKEKDAENPSRRQSGFSSPEDKEDVVPVEEGVVSKRGYECLDCGKQFMASREKNRWPTCPECHAGGDAVMQTDDADEDIDEDSMNLTRSFTEARSYTDSVDDDDNDNDNDDDDLGDIDDEEDSVEDEGVQLIGATGPMDEGGEWSEGGGDDPWENRPAEDSEGGKKKQGRTHGYEDDEEGDMDECDAVEPAFTGSGMDPWTSSGGHSRGLAPHMGRKDRSR